MMQFITGFFVNQAVRAFAKFGVADLLATRPPTAPVAAALSSSRGLARPTILA